MGLLNIDLQNTETQEGFEILPVGWYDAEVADSEIKTGAKGQYINWTFAIENKPNKVWDIMSLGNEVSLKRLKTLATCGGHPNPNYIADSDELHGMKVAVRLKIETDESGTYEPKNRITSFKRISGNNSQPELLNPKTETPPASKQPWE